VRILSRREWGADLSLKRRGHLIGPSKRTEVFIHHTALRATNATRNQWKSLRQVRESMQQLQRARPDLGLDVPYNFVAYSMQSGELVLCEGRGLDRTAAHAKNHNRSGLSIAFQGNFETTNVPRQFREQLSELTAWLQSLRNSRGFANLGDSRPDGKHVWGHRDAKSAKTLCPGSNLYELLPIIRFITEEDDNAMDRATWKFVQRSLQALEPPLYAGKAIDGRPGRNTNTALRAFEKRMQLEARGVIGALGDPNAAIWPATRELLFVVSASAASGG
jgi:hypothetical protein